MGHGGKGRIVQYLNVMKQGRVVIQDRPYPRTVRRLVLGGCTPGVSTAGEKGRGKQNKIPDSSHCTEAAKSLRLYNAPS